MAGLILGVTAAAVVAVILLLRRELLRNQEAGRSFAALAPLRVVSGTLLIVVFVLVAAGLLFAVPREGDVAPRSTVLLAYWLFIALLLVAILLLAGFDIFLVRRGFQIRQDEAFRDALIGRGRPRTAPQKKEPDAGGEKA